MALFKFGRQVKNRQAAKLKSPPNKPRIQYAWMYMYVRTYVYAHACTYVRMSAHMYTHTCIPGMNQVYEYLYDYTFNTLTSMKSKPQTVNFA